MFSPPPDSSFTLDEFKRQLLTLIQPGLMMRMISWLPGMGQMLKQMAKLIPERDVRRLIGIIDAMTPSERKDPALIDLPRRKRIARGAGTALKDVSGLVRQIEFMRAHRHPALPDPCSPIPPESFRDGMVVEHPHYGRGEIVAISGIGQERKAVVRFHESQSSHTFVLAFSELRPVTE